MDLLSGRNLEHLGRAYIKPSADTDGEGHPPRGLRFSSTVLSENHRVFSVVLFDEKGRVAMFSNPLEAGNIVESPDAQRVIATGGPVEIVRRRGGSEVYSFIMPIRISAARRGAFEISQPAEFIKADYARARRDIALITLALFAAIIAVVLLVMRYNLLRPIKELLGGAKAVGQGDLAYRVVAPSGGNEIAQLASEFNRMAESLAEQRRAAERQAEERLALERELRQSERLASVGRLAAGVAHEMGAPLNVIKGRVEMLREHAGAPCGRMRARAMRTEEFASLNRRLATRPSPARFKRPRPCWPIMTRSGFHSATFLIISCYGLPANFRSQRSRGRRIPYREYGK